MSVGTAWIGIIAYTLQIYFDFSGYSDMAIGLGKMFGFDFPKTSTIRTSLNLFQSFGEDGILHSALGSAITYISRSAETAFQN